MSTEIKAPVPKEEEDGRRVDLHTSSGETICLSFPENETPLPQVIKLVDPDTGQAILFQHNDGVYNEFTGELDDIIQLHSNNEEANGQNDLQFSTDERVEKQRERLQKKLRERKGSSNKEDDNCLGYCNQVIEIPVQGLSQIRDSSQGDENPGEDDSLSIEEERCKAEGLKIHRSPEVEVVDSTSMELSWSKQVSNNGHLLDCKFELQMATKNANYTNIYSGSNTEYKKSDLKPGTTYKFRLCALKDKIKGDFSPEVHAQTKSTVPAVPSSPYLANKTKTGFSIKWNAPGDNGSPIKTYKLEWDKGEGKGKYYDIYNGNQRHHKLSHKLLPGTRCVFRVQAINDIGASEFSKDLVTFTSAGVADAPKAPHLDRAGPNYLAVLWNKPECNGAEINEYLLEMEDTTMAYGFMVAYRGPEPRCQIEKLKRNNSYKFRVSANNSQGSSRWSQVAMFNTTPERPGRPSPPLVQGKPKTTSFDVTWDHPDDTGGTAISKYTLEMDDGKGGPFREVYSGLECEQTLNSLSPGHTYKLRVSCYSEGGYSEWSRICKVRTLPVNPGQANQPIMSKIHKPQANALHLYWDPPDYSGGASITSYILLMEVEKTSTKEYREIYRGVDNLCTISGLQPGRAYSFCVRAVNEAGVGKPSIISELSTAPGVPDPPRAPDTLCRSAAAIQITWEAPAENGTPVTGYTLEMMDDETFIELYTGYEKTYELRKGVSPASYYYFRVKALSVAGASLWSAVSTCQTPAASPAAVSSVRMIEQSSCHVRLRWKHPSNNGAPVTSYNIEIAGVRNISYDVIDDDDEPQTNVSRVQEYDVVDLHPNTAYRIRVQAVNKIGCGSFSPLIVVTTRDLPPSAPALELASASYQSLKLRWGSAGSKDSVGITYALDMLDQTGNFQTVFVGSSTSHKAGKLREKTEYEFRIQASNEAGTGPYSEAYSFSTTAQPPSAVKGLRAENVTPSRFTVCWDAVQSIKRTDTIEYLLQCQEVGKRQDFVLIYQGPQTEFAVQSLATGKEFRFRVCAVRHTQGEDSDPDSPSRGLKGVFSPIVTVKSHSPRRNPRVSESLCSEDDDELEIEQSKQLTDNQWAMIIFGGFTLLALGFAFIVPLLFDVSD